MERDCKGSCNSLAAEKRRAQLFSAPGNTALSSVWFLEEGWDRNICINILVYTLWTWVREYAGKYCGYECVYVSVQFVLVNKCAGCKPWPLLISTSKVWLPFSFRLCPCLSRSLSLSLMGMVGMLHDVNADIPRATAENGGKGGATDIEREWESGNGQGKAVW